MKEGRKKKGNNLKEGEKATGFLRNFFFLSKKTFFFTCFLLLKTRLSHNDHSLILFFRSSL